MMNFNLSIVYQLWFSMKNPIKLDSSMESKAKINYLLSNWLPFKHSINITGSRLISKETRPCHYKVFLDSVNSIPTVKLSFSDSNKSITIPFKIVPY